MLKNYKQRSESMSNKDFESFFKNEIFPIIQELLEEYTSHLLKIEQLPLVLTNEDLKGSFKSVIVHSIV